MRAVFLDTVGLIGIWDEDDQWHAAASVAWAELVKTRALLFTTRFVLAECGNTAARRAYRAQVVQLHDELEVVGGVLAMSEQQWREAWDAYGSDRPGGPGLVDQTSFAVMRRYDLREAFTNDHHFRAAGFEPLF